MGIEKLWGEYEKKIFDLVGLSYNGLKWCELGNQIIRYGDWDGKAAKIMYESLGVDHTSIDLNGLNGALVIDLDKPVPKEFIGKFDVVTNYGTIEHVNNQFQAFKNMHDMAKEKGIIIHNFPLVGNLQGHCRYHYSTKFVKQLIAACKYQLIILKIFDKDIHKYPLSFIAAAYIKNPDSKFISDQEFKKLDIEDCGDLRNTGKSMR